MSTSTTGVITIRAQTAKLERARLVPLHHTTVERSTRYAPSSVIGCARSPDQARSSSPSAGTALDRQAVAKTLRTLTTALGLRTDTAHPTAHHLRHSFAVRTLIGWQRSAFRSTSRSPLLSTYLGHVSPAESYWYLTATPELMDSCRPAARAAPRRTAMTPLAPSMQAYFTDRLIGQRPPARTRSPPTATPSSCCCASRPSGPAAPRQLDIADLDAPLIAAFLDHLEHDRGNTSRPATTGSRRSTRCSRYLALHHPEHAAHDPARARDPSQAHRAQPADLPHRPGSRRPARRARSDDLDRPARPRDARRSRSRPACGSPN